MATDKPMQLGMIGLGRMGSNLVRRLMRDGHQCVAYDVKAEAVKKLAAEGADGASSLKEFVGKQPVEVIGKPFAPGVQQVDNRRLLAVNQATEGHPVEKVGATLRGYMTAMKQIAVGG